MSAAAAAARRARTLDELDDFERADIRGWIDEIGDLLGWEAGPRDELHDRVEDLVEAVTSR